MEKTKKNKKICQDIFYNLMRQKMIFFQVLEKTKKFMNERNEEKRKKEKI